MIKENTSIVVEKHKRDCINISTVLVVQILCPLIFKGKGAKKKKKIKQAAVMLRKAPMFSNSSCLSETLYMIYVKDKA